MCDKALAELEKARLELQVAMANLNAAEARVAAELVKQSRIFSASDLNLLFYPRMQRPLEYVRMFANQIHVGGVYTGVDWRMDPEKPMLRPQNGDTRVRFTVHQIGPALDADQVREAIGRAR